MIFQTEIFLPAFNRGFHLITSKVLSQLPELPDKGIMHIFIQHTSAAITINENFDDKVRTDFESFFNRLIPDDSPYLVHQSEGGDDIPAHLKAALMGQSVIIPITNKRLNLGTWQGIYLCEFRNRGGRRKLVVTIYN